FREDGIDVVPYQAAASERNGMGRKIRVAADLDLEGSYVECSLILLLQLVMVHYRVIARHDLGDRVGEILCAAAEVALNYSCLAAGSDHDQAARMGNDRHVAACREKHELNRFLDDYPTGNIDASAILEISGIQGNKRTIPIGRVTRQVRFDGAVRFA